MSENPIPFFTQTALLDQYIHSENPGSDPDIVSLIVNILRTKEELRTYFFRSGPSAAWAPIFWENGFLSVPPEPVNTKDGYSLKPWDVQYFLIAIAPQVPEIVVNHVEALNGHAWYRARAIEALSKIPVQFSEKAVPTVVKWLSEPEIAETGQTDVLSLIKVMIKNEKTSIALDLFDLLAAPRDESKKYNTRRSFQEVFGYGYEKSDVFELLKSAYAPELIQILERHLVKSLYSEENGIQEISWWRNTIEDSGQGFLDDYRDFILSALRDTFFTLVEKHSEQSIDIVTNYLKSNYTILRRLGLYLIGHYPTIFRAEAIKELLNPINLDDSNIHHEFFLLLENCFPMLSESNQRSLIKTILDGPNLKRIEQFYESYEQAENPDRDKFISNWKNAWIRDRLWMISSHLDNETKPILDGLVELGGKPEHPAFLAWSSGAFSVADISPYTELELSKYSPEQLLDLLKSWRPEPKKGFSPEHISYAGLAKELAKMICSSPERYRNLLPEICLLHPENAVAIFSLWTKPEYDVPIPWEIALELCEKLLDEDRVWNNEPRQGYEVESWRNVRFNVARLLEISLVNKKKLIPENLLENIRALLLLLLDDPDPTIEDDRPKDGWWGHNDPITIALNRVRPLSFKALILCEVRIAILEGAEENKLRQDMPLSLLMREKLEEKLDPKIEPSRAMRSVFGEYISTLYWLDHLWLEGHLDLIFPGDRNDESTWLFMSAWDAYILNKYSRDIFEVMRPKYALAIEYLSMGYKTESTLGQAGYLSAHLIFDYLFSEFSLERFLEPGSLLQEFFQKTQPEIRRQAAWALWRILESNPDNLSGFWPKAKELWKWRAKEATISNHSPDFNAEMMEFAQVLKVAPEFETLRSMQYLLDGLLPHLRQAELHDIGWTSVEIFLAQKVEKEPVEVINFYRLMCEQKFNVPQWIYFSEHAKKIMTITADNPRSRIDALALIDFFAQRWRDFDTFKSIYQKYAG